MLAGPEHPTVATEMRSRRFRKSSSWTSRPGIETDRGPRLTGKVLGFIPICFVACGVENDRFGSGSVYRETDAYQCRQSARQRVRFWVAACIIVGHRAESVWRKLFIATLGSISCDQQRNEHHGSTQAGGDQGEECNARAVFGIQAPD